MTGMNQVLDFQVITPDGPKWVRELNHGDQVYEYGTGRKLTFYSQEIQKPHTVYEVVYSDRRSMLVNGNDMLYVGNKKISKLDFLMRNDFYRLFFVREAIDHKPVDFPGFGTRPKLPDPYVSGALWYAGDWEDPDMNMSLTATEANGVLMNKYNIEYVDRIKKGKVYFRYVESDHVISWTEFFQGLNWYPVNQRADADIIPREFMYGKAEVRKQFLRGVFDVGFQQNNGDGHLILHHQKEGRLRELQRMLWGMGILSSIMMDKKESAHEPDSYRLMVVDDKWRYPGFLYHTQKIEQEIIYERQISLVPAFKLIITQIRPPKGPAPMSRGVVPGVKLSKHHAVFYDGNYLPRVSL